MSHVHSCVRREKFPKEWEGLSEMKVKNEGGVGERKKGNEHLPSLPDHGTYPHILGQCLLHLFEFCGMHFHFLPTGTWDPFLFGQNSHFIIQVHLPLEKHFSSAPVTSTEKQDIGLANMMRLPRTLIQELVT